MSSPPSPARGRPREFDADQALDAALLLFWRHGFEGTSMAALTAATGVSMPSLYAAFGNKDALFRRALDRYLATKASYLPDALRAPTARAVVAALFDGAIAMVMNRRHPDGCLLVHGALATGPTSEGVRAELAQRRTAAEAAVRRRFAAAVESGELPRGTEPAKLAAYVITLIWGLSVQAAGGATRGELKRVGELVLANWPPRTP